MKHMHIDKEIKNSEVKGKSLVFLSSNSEHNGTQNITGVLKFGEPLDSHDTFVLDLCELPIKPSKQRNRSIIFGE